MPRRLVSWPAALAVVVVGSAASIGAISACGDDTQPQECTIQGECPSDGRVCLHPQDASLCCPICPVNNACPDGCTLDFPPV